jgi:hypothetical protein
MLLGMLLVVSYSLMADTRFSFHRATPDEHRRAVIRELFGQRN